MSEGSQTSQTTVSSVTPTVTPRQIVVSNENPNLRITSASASSSFAHSGNFTQSGNSKSMSAFMSHSVLPWIINFGASDHITGQSNLFSSYTPYIVPEKVKIAYGAFSSVSGVHITPSLSLSSVLHVSSFAVNLLSISRMARITRDLN